MNTHRRDHSHAGAMRKSTGRPFHSEPQGCSESKPQPASLGQDANETWKTVTSWLPVSQVPLCSHSIDETKTNAFCSESMTHHETKRTEATASTFGLHPTISRSCDRIPRIPPTHVPCPLLPRWCTARELVAVRELRRRGGSRGWLESSGGESSHALDGRSFRRPLVAWRLSLGS